MFHILTKILKNCDYVDSELCKLWHEELHATSTWGRCTKIGVKSGSNVTQDQLISWKRMVRWNNEL